MFSSALLVVLVLLSSASGSPTATYEDASASVKSGGSHVVLGDISFSSTTSLLKRWDGSPAMGQELTKAKDRACTLWSMMHANDASAGQLFTPRAGAHSDYLQPQDLQRWGYITKTPRKNPKCDMGNGKDMFGLEAVLQAKHISADKKDWKCIIMTHGDPQHKTTNIDDQVYTNPRGQTVRVTGALFYFAINEKDGVLIMAKRYGVAHQSQYRRPPVQASDFPDLRSSSDMAWLAWKPYHEKGVKLEHVFTWSVTNGGTQRLIAAALETREMDKTPKAYPWVGWSANSLPGQLVLGSPNGIGVGYLLAQHKPELGNRCVRNIEVFLADTASSNIYEPTLYWQIEDLPVQGSELLETLERFESLEVEGQYTRYESVD